MLYTIVNPFERSHQLELMNEVRGRGTSTSNWEEGMRR